MNLKAVLVGNPNSGKSTLFNGLTGLKQPIGNYPGVTVEKSQSVITFSEHQLDLTDLPGVYSLVPQQQNSQDERVTLNYLLNNDTDLLINVVDATSLERHLYLTLQLRELDQAMIVVLNKWDLALKQGLSIDIEQLTERLGCPVITLSSKQKFDKRAVLEKLVSSAKFAKSATYKPLTIDYGTALTPLLTQTKQKNNLLAVIALSKQTTSFATSELDIELEIASVRYQWCNLLYLSVVKSPHLNQESLSAKVDNWLLKPQIAIPVFLGAMYLMFMFAIRIGGAFIDFFDIAMGAIFVDGLAQLLTSMHVPEWLVVVLTDGAGTGVQTVATFIPLIFCLYLFLTALEQSGYLARAAVVTDRIMQKIGLPGSAFVPMLMGFGCTVPAVMATRTLKQQRERILSGVMSHFMSCGARLPVFALFGAAFFLDNALNLVFLLYIIGIVIAVLTGLLFRKTLLKGESSAFVIELPVYQLPLLSDLFKRSLKRLKGFVFGAGKTIVIVVTFLGLFSSLGVDGSFGNAGKSNSVLSKVGQIITPIFEPMGIDEDNWQATVGIFTGLFAKEVLVASLNTLYQDQQQVDEPADLLTSLNLAVQSIGDNFSGVLDFALDPLGLGVANVASEAEAAESQGVALTTLARIKDHFHGQIGAFSYLLFILLYAPCASAIGAMSREYGGRWALFIGLWTTYIAYVVAGLFFQFATLDTYGLDNGITIMLLLLSFVPVYWLLNSVQLSNWLQRGKLNVKKNTATACH